MNILHIIATLAPRYGGPSKACIEMARAVALRGHHVSIYTTNLDGDGVLPVPLDRPVLDNGVEIRYFSIQPPKFWGTSWPMAQALKKDLADYDIAHVHSLYQFHDLIAGSVCRNKRIAYIIRPHGSLDPFLYRRHRARKTIMENWFENRNIKGASAIHFTTDEEMELAKPHIFSTPGVVVPNGLNLKDYADLPPLGSFRDRYPSLSGKKIILFLGRINFKKGFDILVPAFAKVFKTFTDIHLVIAGPDNDGYGQKVKGWLEEYNLTNNATFTGMLRGRGKLAAFRDAEMFVLPSYTENFGISVLEAMACGVPVVISDKVNIWREVKNGNAGLVVSTKADDFAESMEKLLLDSDLGKKMGQRGQYLVKQYYQWEAIGKKLEDVYVSLLHKTK